MVSPLTHPLRLAACVDVIVSKPQHQMWVLCKGPALKHTGKYTTTIVLLYLMLSHIQAGQLLSLQRPLIEMLLQSEG